MKVLDRTSDQLSDTKLRLQNVEAESSRLAEENERLSEQLAAKIERPRAEGQESNGTAAKNNSVENGHQEGQEWQKKYQVIVQEKEKM